MVVNRSIRHCCKIPPAGIAADAGPTKVGGLMPPVNLPAGPRVLVVAVDWCRLKENCGQATHPPARRDFARITDVVFGEEDAGNQGRSRIKGFDLPS